MQISFINQLIGRPFSSIDILTITSLAVALEQIGPLGIDNITVPVGVAFSWQWLLFH